MPDKETMEHIANLFKGFADPTRVHILSLLRQNEELCVNDIAEAVELSQSAISHQLRILKQMKIIIIRNALLHENLTYPMIVHIIEARRRWACASA